MPLWGHAEDHFELQGLPPFMNTARFATPEEIAELSARMLLEINAVHFRADEPYRLTSGLASPVYIDCRKLIAFPRIRSTLMDFALATVQRGAGFEAFDVIAGGETAGIPFAAWIADRLALPMVYVRKKPKGFGRNSRIEGYLEPGQRVLLVEDLTTDGGSKLNFAEALREADAVVQHTLVVFYYDVFDHAQPMLDKAGLDLHWLCTWRDVLRAANATGRFDVESRNAVEAFLNDPLAWSAEHGGEYIGPGA